MCRGHHSTGNHVQFVAASKTRKVELSDALSVARFLVDQPELRFVGATGLEGYGSTRKGDKVLICTDSLYDPQVADLIGYALREKGARVDQLVVEVEPDREFTEVDEVGAMMRRCSWIEEPRRYEGIHWVEQMAIREDYDLLVLGRGGPGNMFDPADPAKGAVRPDNWPKLRYEQIPWFDLRQLCAPYATFPRDLHVLINEKVHEAAVVKSRGGTIRLTDPEGTDVRWTNFEEYYGTERYWDTSGPIWCHIQCHATPPLLPKEDAEGVVAGTINHFGRPFPNIKTYYEGGKLTSIEGGGEYGDAWRSMVEETKSIQYPSFPSPGLFWLYEVAIGTNPKIIPEPPERIRFISSGGVEKERGRSGVIHFGIGCDWRDRDEVWAGSQGLLHGHLHVHLFFATLEVKTSRGETLTVVENGRLTALDDPEVRKLAAKYGDPDEVLKEAWIPKIPGINVPGDYHHDFGRDPATWIYMGNRDR